jgi:hypothetical protein
VGLLPNFFPSYCDTNWLQGMALFYIYRRRGEETFFLLVNRSPGVGSRSALKGVCHKIFDHLLLIKKLPFRPGKPRILLTSICSTCRVLINGESDLAGLLTMANYDSVMLLSPASRN